MVQSLVPEAVHGKIWGVVMVTSALNDQKRNGAFIGLG